MSQCAAIAESVNIHPFIFNRRFFPSSGSRESIPAVIGRYCEYCFFFFFVFVHCFVVWCFYPAGTLEMNLVRASFTLVESPQALVPKDFPKIYTWMFLKITQVHTKDMYLMYRDPILHLFIFLTVFVCLSLISWIGKYLFSVSDHTSKQIFAVLSEVIEPQNVL